jgi:AAA+ ATPase superfamily predicted ATPase
MDATNSAEPVDRFVDNATDRNTLALVYGRRRIGKSTLLAALTRARRGFYWEATRAESAIHLARLGDALGAHLGVGRLALEGWEDALARLLHLGASAPTPVVLDEFGYLLEAEPGLDSTVATLLGPARRETGGRARLILCGSAIAMMRKLTGGQAPLRGRAGLELVMQPFDFRRAAALLGDAPELTLAARVFAVIGGVVGYATDMVDDDLPRDPDDFSRWVAERVLSPAATLHHEATTLLAEDPTLAAASQTLHHSILGVIANGVVTAGAIANQLRRPVPNLDPALKRLVAAGFIVRHEDPVRARRPVYALGDPFLQFHYAVLEPHATALRERDPRATWERRLAPVFDSRVRGPVFEEQARTWVRRFAAPGTIGGEADHVGPSAVTIDGIEHQLDVVAAADGGGVEPSERTVLAVGEAKSGEAVGAGHLRRLERARSALGPKAASARLLLFAPAFTADLERVAAGRSDVELVGFERLYRGA